MNFTGRVLPPRYSVREVITAWMTASTSGPPRLCSISVIADIGPIWSKPTPAIAARADADAADHDGQDQVREVGPAAMHEHRAVQHRENQQKPTGDRQHPR